MKNRWKVALAGLIVVLAGAGLYAATTLGATAVVSVSGSFVNDLDLGTDPTYNFKGGTTLNLTPQVPASPSVMALVMLLMSESLIFPGFVPRFT